MLRRVIVALLHDPDLFELLCRFLSSIKIVFFVLTSLFVNSPLSKPKSIASVRMSKVHTGQSKHPQQQRPKFEVDSCCLPSIKAIWPNSDHEGTKKQKSKYGRRAKPYDTRELQLSRPRRIVDASQSVMNSLWSKFVSRKASSSWFSKISDAPRFPGNNHIHSHGEEDETYYLAFVFEVAVEVINSVAGRKRVFVFFLDFNSNVLSNGYFAARHYVTLPAGLLLKYTLTHPLP